MDEDYRVLKRETGELSARRALAAALRCGLTTEPTEILRAVLGDEVAGDVLGIKVRPVVESIAEWTGWVDDCRRMSLWLQFCLASNLTHAMLDEIDGPSEASRAHDDLANWLRGKLPMKRVEGERIIRLEPMSGEEWVDAEWTEEPSTGSFAARAMRVLSEPNRPSRDAAAAVASSLLAADKMLTRGEIAATIDDLTDATATTIRVFWGTYEVEDPNPTSLWVDPRRLVRNGAECVTADACYATIEVLESRRVITPRRAHPRQSE